MILTKATRSPAHVLHFGEIHTGLLQNPAPLTPEQVADLLDLVVGERVRTFTRPMPHAVSPDLLTGVDCSLPSTAGREMRAIGTVIGHVSVTGGHVLQASAHTQISAQFRPGQRPPWSYYLAQPGRLEAIGRVDLDDAATGFLTGRRRPVTLDVGAVATRMMDDIQRSPLLRRKPPFRSRRTVLRWVVLPVSAGSRSAMFSLESPDLRTLSIRLDEPDTEAVLSLCENLALHDWLLTTLVQIVATGVETPGGRVQRAKRLGSAVDFLLHLWMPGARVVPELLPLWELLDSRSGMSRQWQTSVDRIRDQLTLSTMTLLEAASAAAETGHPGSA